MQNKTSEPKRRSKSSRSTETDRRRKSNGTITDERQAQLNEESKHRSLTQAESAGMPSVESCSEQIDQSQSALDLAPPSVLIPQASRENPRRCPTARKALHNETLTGGIYGSLLQVTLKGTWGGAPHLYDDTCATSVLSARDFLRSMQPRDAMEEMLLSQALWTHGRIAYLTQLLSQGWDIDKLDRLSAIVERANNTYRRQMLALAEYRRPATVRGPLTSIEQANIAGQQIIVNHQEHKNENTTNEQGLPQADGTRYPNSLARKAAIPPEPQGTCLSERGSHDKSSLGEIDWPQDDRR